MNMIMYAIAVTEWVLVFPAALFMTAVFVQSGFERAETARRLVGWFSTHVFLGLYIFLIAMPLAALVIGAAALLGRMRKDAELRQAVVKTLAMARAHAWALITAGAAVMAAGILTIVAIHMITQ
jgi:hypothetical protein